MNFPTTHPLWGGANSRPYVAEADVILIIDHDVPYIPCQTKPAPEAKIIHIDIDPVKKDIPTWSFPADILVEADSSKAIPALTDIIRKMMTPEQESKFLSRFQQIKSEHLNLREGWLQSALSKSEQKPIAHEWLSYCIAEVMDDDTIILDESITSSQFVWRQVPRRKPGTLFNSAGSGLGWSLGDCKKHFLWCV